jgi:hypothetical protein
VVAGILSLKYFKIQKNQIKKAKFFDFRPSFGPGQRESLQQLREKTYQ